MVNNIFLNLSRADLMNISLMPKERLCKIDGLLAAGHISDDFYAEIIGLWYAFRLGLTTVDEYIKKRQDAQKL
jgi:hypothetical protein